MFYINLIIFFKKIQLFTIMESFFSVFHKSIQKLAAEINPDHPQLHIPAVSVTFVEYYSFFKFHQ